MRASPPELDVAGGRPRLAGGRPRLAGGRHRLAGGRHRLAGKELPRKELPRKELPRKELPRKELPRKELPRKELPRKGLPRSVLRSDAVRAMAGRLSWGLADQAVSSLTNFAVGICVARSLGLTAFGTFSLAWVTYAVAVNLSRGLATDPLLVRFSGVPGARWRAAMAQSSSTALLVGLATGATSLLAGLLIGGLVGSGFVALGLVLPALLLQDSWRYAFFASGQGRKAFFNDAVWAVALVPAVLLAARNGSVFTFVLAWGVAGAVAAGYGVVQTKVLPRVRGIRSWLMQHRDLGPRYMIENVCVSSAEQLRMYGLGAIAGLAAVGAVRGAQLLLAPFFAVLLAMSMVSVPEAARVLKRSPRRLPLFCLLLGGSEAVAGTIWGLAVLFLLPAEVGQELLGSVWPAAYALIVPTTLVFIGGGLIDGASAGLRALGAARRSLRARLIGWVAYVSCGLAGAAVGGAAGSVWGVAAAIYFSAVVTWWQLLAAMGERTGPTASPSSMTQLEVEAIPS
jgi:O-antigen/teichoic acid export membrane protein